MTRLWLLLVLACGAPQAPASKSDPHASRDALVREIVARLGTGNVDELVALVPHEAGLGSAITCDRPDRLTADQAGRREVLAETAKNFKGVALEVVAITTSTADEVSTQPAGEEFAEGCKLTVPIRWEPLDVKVRGAGRESNIWINVWEIAGRWYLVVMQDKPT